MQQPGQGRICDSPLPRSVGRVLEADGGQTGGGYIEGEFQANLIEECPLSPLPLLHIPQNMARSYG